MQSIGEITRKQETEYRRGSVQMSKYVLFDMHDTIEQVDAYLNSKHVSGEKDSLGRDKPFFNICVAQANIWTHATDIDRKNIKLRATNSKSWINSYLYTIKLQEWMRRERFGKTLNTWGQTLARYGSAVLKIIENEKGLHITVVPWQRLICDPVEFDPNPKIETLELTPAQLMKRVQTHGYNQGAVTRLLDAAKSVRETATDRLRKDNRPGFIKLYETHGLFSMAQLKKAQGIAMSESEEAANANIFVQQMHVISFVGKKDGRKTEYQDFTLFAGEESEDPYMITHLLEEDGRTLARGAVENLLQSQWMVNHSMKAVKDTLDLASKLIWQTADPFFVGQNVLENIETGDILVHAINMPLTKVDTSKPDIGEMSGFALQWKQNGNEINNITDVMLGHLPKGANAARQISMLLQESYSMFEYYIENKGQSLEALIRDRILPYIKKRELNNAKEISAILDDHDIKKIDAVYLKDAAIRQTNQHVLGAINDNLDRIARGQDVQPIDAAGLLEQNSGAMQESLSLSGNTRFFKPSDLSDATWAEQLKDTEVVVEVDITGEEFDAKEMLADLAQAVQMVMQPGFEQNEKAKAIVGRMLEITGTMSPVEYNALPSAPPPAPPGAGAGPTQPSPLPASTGSGR